MSYDFKPCPFCGETECLYVDQGDPESDGTPTWVGCDRGIRSMKTDWRPITEPPRVPETKNCIAVLCVWEMRIPEVLLYWPEGVWTDIDDCPLAYDDLPDKWTHLPDILDAFE